MSKKKLSASVTGIIYTCSLFILCLLFLISIFSTCTIGADATGETTIFYNHDYPILHFLFLLLSLYFVHYFKHKQLSEKNYQRIQKYALLIWVIFAFAWVLLYMKEPTSDSDPKHVLDAAAQMREYNFTSFTEGHYLNKWAGNRKLTLFFYLLSYVIGINNLTALRVLNVLALLMAFWLLYKISNSFWQNHDGVSSLQMMCCVIFIPGLLYTTFIYGDVYGFALAIAAIYAEVRYTFTRKVKWALLSSILIAFASMLKMNELIILIAMFIMLLYDIILSGQWKKGMLCLFLIVGITSGFHAGSNLILEKITKMELSEGVPLEAWIAMGLQDNGIAPPGQYNGYNLSIYCSNNYDHQKAKTEALNNIKESLANFKSNPKTAFSFFLRKIAGQWSNPDCESLRSGLAEQTNLSSFVNCVLSGKLQSILRLFLNLLQTWILFGAICYILLRKNKTDYEWIFMLVFLGGFLFHLFWEAGSRYAFPYYIMLLPYSCMGIYSLENYVESYIQCSDTTRTRKKYTVTALIVSLVLTCVLSETPVFKAIGLVSEKEGLKTEKKLENGFYKIKAGCDDELYLTEQDGNVLIMSGDVSQQVCSLYCNPTEYIIRFQPSQNVMDLAVDESVYSSDNNYPFEWKIQPVNDHQFHILMNDETALMYSLEDWSVKLVPFESGNQEQLWEIQKVY